MFCHGATATRKPLAGLPINNKLSTWALVLLCVPAFSAYALHLSIVSEDQITSLADAIKHRLDNVVKGLAV